MSAVASLLAALPTDETLPVLLMSVLGSAVFIALVLCVRRFDREQGTDGDGSGGGGGGRGPGPDPPAEPLDVVDPALGEIRASRKPSARASRERREKIAS